MADSPQPSAGELQAFDRFLKILYFTLLASMGLYWVVLEMLTGQREPGDLGPTKLGVQGFAGVVALTVLYLRFVRLAPLLADTTGELGARLGRLRFYYILCYTLSESVALYGFVLRFLGASREEAIPFFGVAVALFLLCYPRLPERPGAG